MLFEHLLSWAFARPVAAMDKTANTIAVAVNRTRVIFIFSVSTLADLRCGRARPAGAPAWAFKSSTTISEFLLLKPEALMEAIGETNASTLFNLIT
jgi:hypothetical protein